MKTTPPSLMTIALAAALGMALGAAAPAPARPAAGVRAQAGAIPLPRFELFGWVSPPVESTTTARYAEMAEAGMTLAMHAWVDPGRREDNLARLDIAASQGLRCLIWDWRFERFIKLEVESPAGGALLDSIVADYASHPAFFGYYLGDEPEPDHFPLLARLHRALRARDPVHPAWNSLFGRGSFDSRAAYEAHTRLFRDTVQPAHLSNNFYEFLRDRNKGLFFENVEVLSALAREAGIPFWQLVLVTEHIPYRPITDGELTWQVSMLLAYGARGVGYFTYWTPAPNSFYDWRHGLIEWDGTRSPRFDLVKRINPFVRAAGTALARSRWISTVHAGGAPPSTTPFVPDDAIAEVEGRAVLGSFNDPNPASPAGARLLLVANKDSMVARRVTLTLRTARPVLRLDQALDQWTTLVPESTQAGARLAIDLEAGGFALLRLEPFPALDLGAGPGLVVAPQPAHGEARFVLARIGDRARLEIVDLNGRLVWSHAPASDDATVTWRGERQGGGRAPAGLYFVRAVNARGVTVRRLHWLGGR